MCLVRLWGGSVAWADDNEFDLRKHIQIFENGLPGQAALQALIEYKQSRGLDSTRPLWDVTIAPG